MDRVYFLCKTLPTHFVMYGRGIPVCSIHDLHTFRILRFYPIPSYDLTDQIIKLQRKWRHRRCYRKWCSNPFRLFYREQYGKFPSLSI